MRPVNGLGIAGKGCDRLDLLSGRYYWNLLVEDSALLGSLDFLMGVIETASTMYQKVSSDAKRKGRERTLYLILVSVRPPAHHIPSVLWYPPTQLSCPASAS